MLKATANLTMADRVWFNDWTADLDAVYFPALVDTGGTAATDPSDSSGFSLSPNYPDPFNTYTNIDYCTNSPGHVRIMIFNNRGEPVAKPMDAFQTSGRHSVIFNGNTLSSGIYLCEIRINRSIRTEKMILMK